MRAVPQLPPASLPSAAPAVRHYENFPVASWLCPPRLRAPIAAIYAFARTADDIADEGDAPAHERLRQLAAYRADLAAAARDARHEISSDWPQVFGPLAQAIERFALPEAPLADLLSAFAQDVETTQAGAAYADRDELLAYCARSAHPVGRLLLHLYGIADAASLAQSDAICSALQLANFWQDLSVDLPRGRFYLPLSDCAAHGLARSDFDAFQPLGPAAAPPEATALIAREVEWTRALMRSGAPLAHRIPGLAGWELRLVVQGGLCILDKLEAQGFDGFSRRPTLGAGDAPRLAWRALCMRGRQSWP